MKECPVCREQFDDQEAFCDQDGTALLDQTDALRNALHDAQQRQSASVWITGAIGGFVGVLICVLLYMLFLAPDPRELNNQDRHPSQASEIAPSRSTQLAAAPAPQTTPPLENPSPSPEEEQPEASPAPSEAQRPATTPALNNGPIATGTKSAREGGERAIIKMKDGSSVEADAAWEDAQGVWYRRSGLVSFVEKSRVEAITDPPPRQPAKAEVKTP